MHTEDRLVIDVNKLSGIHSPWTTRLEGAGGICDSAEAALFADDAELRLIDVAVVMDVAAEGGFRAQLDLDGAVTHAAFDGDPSPGKFSLVHVQLEGGGGPITLRARTVVSKGDVRVPNVGPGADLVLDAQRWGADLRALDVASDAKGPVPGVRELSLYSLAVGK